MIRKYGGEEISIPHKDMVTLRNSGKLNLGMLDDLAIKVVDDTRYAPKSIKSNLAMHFWTLVAVGQFFYAIYKSFTGIWWLFIPSFFLMFIIHRANKKGTSQNLLDEAMADKDFYERVRKANGWLYEIDEKDAKKNKKKK